MATGGDTLSGGEEFAKLLSDFLDFSKKIVWFRKWRTSGIIVVPYHTDRTDEYRPEGHSIYLAHKLIILSSLKNYKRQNW